MISFRYHLVSVVAVLLALALGLLAGASVLDRGLVATLERQTEQWESRARGLQAEVERLRAFTNEAAPYLASGRLLGRDVVIVTQDDVDGALLTRARRALTESGAAVVGILSVRARVGSEDPAVQRQLAELLDQPFAVSGELPGLTARALAEHLASGVARRIGDLERIDILARLVEADFLASLDREASEEGLRGVGGPGQVVVVLGGGDGEPALATESFLIPLTRELVTLGAPVAVGESAASTYGLLETLRSDGTTSGDGVVTVEAVDEPVGSAALILGLQRLIELGQGGHYGIGGDSLLPAA